MTSPNEKTTLHHNIPRSRGGSHEEVNLTLMPECRHDGYHQWASNLTPCYALRMMALNSIGTEGKSLNSETLKTLFKITMRRDWNLLYDPFAVRNLIMPKAIRYAEKVAENSIVHLEQERREIRRVLRLLTEANPHRSKSPALKHALRFFDAETPGTAIERFCTERFDDELCWAKPMKQLTRKGLVDMAKHSDYVSMGRLERSRIVEVLKIQLGFVERHRKEWQEELLPPENGNGNGH